MSAPVHGHETAKWDSGFTERLVNAAEPSQSAGCRFEVHVLESLPPNGGALVVSNHSGGMLTPDVLIFASAFYRRFGYDRPLYTLGHDGMFAGPGPVGRCGWRYPAKSRQPGPGHPAPGPSTALVDNRLKTDLRNIASEVPQSGIPQSAKETDSWLKPS